MGIGELAEVLPRLVDESRDGVESPPELLRPAREVRRQKQGDDSGAEGLAVERRGKRRIRRLSRSKTSAFVKLVSQRASRYAGCESAPSFSPINLV